MTPLEGEPAAVTAVNRHRLDIWEPLDLLDGCGRVDITSSRRPGQGQPTCFFGAVILKEPTDGSCVNSPASSRWRR